MSLDSMTTKRISAYSGRAAFNRGARYAREGRVEISAHTPDHVEAVVRGAFPYFVAIKDHDGDISWSCTCPVGDRREFCKHCVAVALVVVGAVAEPEHEPDQPQLKATVASLPHDRLADVLTELAEVDPILAERLRTESRIHGGGDIDVKSWRSRLSEAFQPRRRFIEYRNVPEWADGVQRLIDGLAEVAETAPSDALAKLIADAHRRADRAVGRIDDSDGYLQPFSAQLGKLHADVCARAGVDPVKLARRLAKLELESELDGFRRCALSHAAALGQRGLAEFRKIVEPKWAGIDYESDDRFIGGFAPREAMVGLALASGDPDELVRIYSRGRLLPDEHLEIAEAMRDAGRPDEAVAWCRRGLEAGRGSPRQTRGLRDTLATLLRERGETDEAGELFWDAFVESPSAAHYTRFVDENKGQQSREALTTRAIDWLQEQIERSSGPDLPHGLGGPYATVLIEILIVENRTDEAWQLAGEHGTNERVWLTLARIRERTHPADAVPIHLQAAQDEIGKKQRRNYRQAVTHLRHIATITDQDRFAKLIAGVRDQHARKTSLMGLFDAEGW